MYLQFHPREWALRKQRFQLKTRTGFHDFFQFLLEEKNAIEYMQDDMRECGNSRGKAHSVITRGSILTKSVKTSSII
jgi:hypothetical protein